LSTRETTPFLKSGLINGVVSLVDNNLVVFYYLSASEIWRDKRDGLSWGLQFSSILSSRWILTLAWQDGWPLVKEALKDGYYFILKFLWSNCMQFYFMSNEAVLFCLDSDFFFEYKMYMYVHTFMFNILFLSYCIFVKIIWGRQ
jgi:hypothetical protein